ncbi:hypothetical protein C8Q75DRAFT_113008 [Abortiporus biennis]|nr:hypothetical protein C8Q75DRAFT_113008 [Abortiporus biennis]
MSEITRLKSTQIQSDVNLYFYLSCISLTILYYDYILTLAAEINLYWYPIVSTIGSRHSASVYARQRSKFSVLTVVFFFTRYLAIFGHIPTAIEVFWPKHTSMRLVGIISPNFLRNHTNPCWIFTHHSNICTVRQK